MQAALLDNLDVPQTHATKQRDQDNARGHGKEARRQRMTQVKLTAQDHTVSGEGCQKYAAGQET